MFNMTSHHYTTSAYKSDAFSLHKLTLQSSTLNTLSASIIPAQYSRLPAYWLAMVDLIGSDGSGFQFDLAKRNQFLEKSGFKKPTDRTTGTTLAGAVFKVIPAWKYRGFFRLNMW